MALAISPAAFMRRGSAGVSIDSLVTLLERPDDLRALRDDLDTRRDAALEAIKAADAKLATEAALAAELEERETKLAALVTDLETREAAVALGRKAISDVVAWFERNPLPSTEGI